MAHSIGNGSAPGVFSQLTRRQLVQNGVLGAGALAVGSLGLLRAARASDEISFWATGTLDIGDDGWRTVANDGGVKVAFTDNGNDPGPVVAKLAAGNANDIYDVGGLQGGSEKELARRGLIAPWDLSQIPNYAGVWQWARHSLPDPRWQGLRNSDCHQRRFHDRHKGQGWQRRQLRRHL